MAQVEVTVNGRNYIVACEDGEEEHLQSLAAYLNHNVTELANSIGQVGEARLMLMAGLLLADELFDARGSVETLEESLARSKAADERNRGEVASAASALIDRLARRLDDIADRLESA
jgi:cell division protein ZapA